MLNILDYTSICDNAATLEMIYIVKTVLNILKIAAPIFLIILSMLDVVRMVTNANMDQTAQSGRILKRMFSAVLIFLLASIIDLVFNVVGIPSLPSTQCWNEATKETVEVLKQAEKEAELAKEEERLQSAKDKEQEEYENRFEDYDDEPGYNAKSTAQKVVDFSKQFIGAPYNYGGPRAVDNPNAIFSPGTDCSGFISILYKHFGYDVGTYTGNMCYMGERVTSIDDLKVGDILCTGAAPTYSHVVMYVGRLKNGEGESSGVADGVPAVIHASNSAPFPSGGVKYTPLSSYSNAPMIRRLV